MTYSIWKGLQPISFVAVVAMLKLHFAVWIVMGLIGGASSVSYIPIIDTPSIVPNSGKMDPLTMFLCLPWALYSTWDIQALVVAARMMETCLVIVGWC